MILNGQMLTVMQLSDVQRKLGILPGALFAGGAAGTVLTKASGADYDFLWSPVLGVSVLAGNGIVFSGGNTIHFAQVAAYTPGAIPFASGAATMGFDAANLFWDDTNDFFGIGTAGVPLAPLHVIHTYADALNQTMVLLTTTNTVSGGAKRCFIMDASYTGAANFNAAGDFLSGGAFRATHNGSGIVSGGLSRIVGLEVYHGKDPLGTGAVDDSIGLFVQSLNQNVIGAITDSYDIFIQTPITTGAITNNYAIWQNNPSAFSFFAGNIAVGTAAFHDNDMIRCERTFTTAGHPTGVSGILGFNTLANTAEFSAGGYFRVDSLSAFNFTSVDALMGVSGQALHDGTGTCTGVTGVRGYAFKTNTGIVSAAYGGRFGVFNQNAVNAIVSGSGILIETPTVTGAITTYYGVRIQAGAGTTVHGVYQAGASDLNYFAGNTSIGVATFSASIPLRIERSVAVTALTAGVSARITNTPAGATAAANYGGTFTLLSAGAQNFTHASEALAAIYGLSFHNGTGTVTSGVGGFFQVTKASTGVITTAYGVRSQVLNNNATNAIGTGYGFYVDTPVTTGAITTYYGLFINTPAGTTNYGMAIQGAAALNYITGFSAFGSNAPVNTVWALLGASTATVASLRIPRGSAAYGGTVEGDFWNDFTQHCLTGVVAGVKQFDSRVLFAQTADQTVTNTNAETTLFGAGVGTLTLPANFFVVGKSLRITLRGRHTIDASPPNFTTRVKLGGVTLASHTHSDLNDTNQYWEVSFILTCRTTGAGGTVIGQGYQIESESTGGDSNAFEPLVMTGTAALDTTVANAVDVTLQPDVADAGSSHTTTNAIVEVIA